MKNKVFQIERLESFFENNHKAEIINHINYGTVENIAEAGFGPPYGLKPITIINITQSNNSIKIIRGVFYSLLAMSHLKQQMKDELDKNSYKPTVKEEAFSKVPMMCEVNSFLDSVPEAEEDKLFEYISRFYEDDIDEAKTKQTPDDRNFCYTLKGNFFYAIDYLAI